MIIAIAVSTTSAVGARAPDVNRIREDVKRAYLDEDFAVIERMIEEFRRTDARTVSGTQKLPHVYDMLSSYEALFGSVTYKTMGKAEQIARKWVAQRPESPVAQMMIAEVMLARSYMVRGSGYVSAISPEQYAAFLKMLAQADFYLRSIKATASRDPHWHVLMMRIQMHTVDQYTFKTYADEALDAFPKYLAIHWTLVSKAQAKWGGSSDWVDYWLDRIEQASSPEDYARSYWYVFDDTFPDIHQADWPRLKAGMDDVVDRYPTDWNLNAFAYFACVSEDRKALRELLDRIGDRIDLDAWRYNETVAHCRQMAEATEPAEQPAQQDWFLVEAYGRDKTGALERMVGPFDVATEEDAVSRAKELAGSFEGVQAYKLEPHPMKQTYKKPIILFREGTIPTRYSR